MRPLAKYGRQIFLEDINLILLGIALLMTIFCWSIGIFIWGITILLLPIMCGLVLLALGGPVILITYLIRKNKDKVVEIKNYGRLKNLAFGTYLGFIVLNPIVNWDENQRQKSGLIISETLENYRKENGRYPTALSDIKEELKDLPLTYTCDKFNYHLTDSSDYDLDIPIPIMDRWHWDREKNVFIYSDF